MNDQTPPRVLSEPGKPILEGVNWGGLKTLYIKEVRRFFKVHMQTVWAPAITTLRYLVIFTVALGRSGKTVMGAPFADFIAPGLIMMGMLQNSFANASFSLMVGKMQGTIVDYLMPPLSTGELIAALVGAAVTRAFLVGGAVWLVMSLWPGVHVWLAHPLSALWFGLLGALMLAFLGVFVVVFAWLSPRVYRLMRLEVTALAQMVGSWAEEGAPKTAGEPLFPAGFWGAATRDGVSCGASGNVAGLRSPRSARRANAGSAVSRSARRCKRLPRSRAGTLARRRRAGPTWPSKTADTTRARTGNNGEKRRPCRGTPP